MAGTHAFILCLCICRPSSSEPKYGTALWAMCSVMQLCSDRVLRNAEHKKTFLQAAMWLISGSAARALVVQQGEAPRECTDVSLPTSCEAHKLPLAGIASGTHQQSNKSLASQLQALLSTSLIHKVQVGMLSFGDAECH